MIDFCEDFAAGHRRSCLAIRRAALALTPHLAHHAAHTLWHLHRQATMNREVESESKVILMHGYFAIVCIFFAVDWP